MRYSGGGGLSAVTFRMILGSNTIPLNGTTEAATGVNSVQSAYTQIVSAAAMTKQSVGWAICGTIENGDIAATKVFFQLALGGAGSELSIAQAKLKLPAGVGAIAPLILSSNQIIAAGTRISFRSTVEAAVAGTVMFGWTIPRVS